VNAPVEAGHAMDLTGRNVLVTGANRGVGAAFVGAALSRRAATVFAAARDTASLPGFADPERVMPVRLDVTDQDQITAAAREHADVDLLVCNAGVTCQRPVLSAVEEATLREVLEVNFFGPLRLVRAFALSLRRPGSGVIFVLSVSAVALSRSAPIYSASKAACLMLALDLREELRETGGTVTVVLPGFIDTDMGAAFGNTAKATPAQIAELSLDGWLAGQHTIWPDRFAELVRDAVGEPFRALLDEPRQVMTGLHAAFRDSGRAGYLSESSTGLDS
jgi:NAD(P)-dependent dehydrogenase (short-subunit alcohol dehydrogenase family)